MVCAMDGVVAGATKPVWLLVQAFQPAVKHAGVMVPQPAKRMASTPTAANPNVSERVKTTPPPVEKSMISVGINEAKRWP